MRRFGAIGNGTHDDTRAFKDAIAALRSGQTLYVPDGNCVLSGTIKLVGGQALAI